MDETYTDPKSDRRKLLEIQLERKPGQFCVHERAAESGAPGTIWNYTRRDVCRGRDTGGATHKPLAKYLSEKIWASWGMGSDAKWQLESTNGMGWAGGGLAATLRDSAALVLLCRRME